MLATHSRPGSRAGPAEHGRGPLAPGGVDAGGGQRRGDRSTRRATPWRVSQADERLLAVGEGQRVRVRRPAARARGAARRARRTARPRCSSSASRPSDESSVCAGRLEGVDGAGRGRRRVVDLVGEPGGQRAQGDQGLALPRRRLDASARCGRAPRSGGRRTGTRRRTARAAPSAGTRSTRPAVDAAAGGEVDAVLVPGPEPAGPAAGHVHPGDDGVLAADVPDQVDGAVDQHPPEVGVLALAEQRRRPGSIGDLGRRPRPARRAARRSGRRRCGSGRRSATRIRSSPGSGARGRPTSRPRRRPRRPASSSRAGRRRRRRRPGTLVSRANGGRASGQRRGVRRAPAGPGPVTTKPLLVADDLGAEPVGARRGADEDEQPARRHLLGGAGVPVGEGERLEVAVAPAPPRPRCGSAPRCWARQ